MYMYSLIRGFHSDRTFSVVPLPLTLIGVLLNQFNLIPFYTIRDRYTGNLYPVASQYFFLNISKSRKDSNLKLKIYIKDYNATQYAKFDSLELYFDLIMLLFTKKM